VQEWEQQCQPVWNDLQYRKERQINGNLFEKTELGKVKNIVVPKIGK